MTTIAFIGAGNMAKAMIAGLIDSGHNPSDIFATTATEASARALRQRFGLQTCSNAWAIENADAVILAVKPQMMQQLCRDLAPSFAKKQPLIISVAAGLTSESILDWLGNTLAACIRCMPNTAAQVGLSATGVFANPHTTLKQRKTAETILQTMGSVTWVDNEDTLHAVTAVAGSGVAYFYRFCELMQEAGVSLGLSPEQSMSLAVQTAYGAGKALHHVDATPGALRKAVTSPGGTTEQALAVFDSRLLGPIILEAMQACAQRSEQLSIELGK